jgi:hypothetical protein
MKAREPRRKVMLKARMRIGAAWRDACILDLSTRGLMIQATEPVRGGSYIEIRRGRHVIIARVMWTRDRRCGLLTQDPLPTEAIISEPDRSQACGAVAPQIERRVDRTPAQRAFDHEQSRWRSRALQFALVVIAGGTCGTIAYGTVSEALSRPLVAVELALAGK